MLTQHLAGKILKGLYSGAAAFLGMLNTTLQGSQTFSDLTDAQWVSVAFFTLVAIGGTFGLAGWAGPARLNGGDGKG
jgi:hypothetical protein